MESAELRKCFYNGGIVCKNLVRDSGNEGRVLTQCRAEFEGNPESVDLIETGKACGSDLYEQKRLPAQPTVEIEVQNA